MEVTSAQALAWRLGRHLLDPVGTLSFAGTVDRLAGGVPAYPESTAALVVGLRRQASGPDDLAAALNRGEVIKTYSFRGRTHLMTPEDAGTYLALRASGKQWERKSWQEFYELTPSDWPAFRETVRSEVADRPLTREELGRELGRQARFEAAGDGLVNGDTLLKSLMWQGDLCFGPSRDGQATLRVLDEVPGWAGLADLDVAGPRAITAYFSSYGPASRRHVHYWLGEGLSAGRKRLDGWLDELADQLVAVDLEGEEAFVLAEDVEELAGISPRETVRLLPGADPWVMGPGTSDPMIVPPAHRALITRGANPVVVDGVVAGTWTMSKRVLTVSSFPESIEPDQDLLRSEVSRLAAVIGEELELAGD